jgi:hypothetical protein
MKIIKLLCVLLSCLSAQAAHRISTEALVSTPRSADYSLITNVRPGDGETVDFNPPIFTWFYNTNHLAGGEQNPNGLFPHWSSWTNAFRLKVGTNAALTGTLAIDVTTDLNFYNFLAPLGTNNTRQFYWQVDYITAGSVYFSSAVRSFTIANGATNWDRSILGDSNYLSTNDVHPRFTFREGQQASIFAWMQTNAYWSIVTNRATAGTNAAWFKDISSWGTNSTRNPTFGVPPFDVDSRVNDLGAIVNLWTFSGDNRWTNASMTGWIITNLNNFATFFNHSNNNWYSVDFGNPAGSPTYLHLLMAGYDWMYHRLGSDTGTFSGSTRTNLLRGIQKTVHMWNWNNYITPFPYTTGGLLFDYTPGMTWETDGPFQGYIYTNGNARYTNIYSVSPTSWGKMPNSHVAIDTHIAMAAISVIHNDGGPGSYAYRWMMNFMLARTTPYAGFAAHHVGPYGYVDAQTYNYSLYYALMVLDSTFPDANLRYTEFCRRYPEWITRLYPPLMRKHHGPYGDGSPITGRGHSGFFGDPRRSLDLAAVSRSGLAVQHYNVNSNLFDNSNSSVAEFSLLPLRWNYRVLPTPETNTTSRVYVEDGFVIASSISPSLIDAYTNGVGFSFQARPRGSGMGHDVASDMSFDLWAYGAQVTSGGGVGLNDYDYVAASTPSLFVNGEGPYDGGAQGNGQYPVYLQSPVVQNYAKILAYTNFSTDFVYTMADGTALWTNSNSPQGIRDNVRSVVREIMFPRSKYWVIRDTFQSVSNSFFTVRWHVPWTFRYTPSDTLVGSEILVSLLDGHIAASNSLSLNATGFVYTASNIPDQNYQTVPRIPVHVYFVSTNQGVFNATGTNQLSVSGTSKNGTSGTNSTLNPFVDGGRTWAIQFPDRAAGLWITNTTATTNRSFTMVIVPQKVGVAAPTFQTLDADTVAVTYDGVTETNTFGTNYAGAFTYRVELASASSGESGESGGAGVSTPGQGRVISGRHFINGNFKFQ